MVDASPVPSVERSKATAVTPLFCLPLNSTVECGGCTRFEPINPFTDMTGRCRPKYRPGFINKHASGCALHRARVAASGAATKAAGA